MKKLDARVKLLGFFIALWIIFAASDIRGCVFALCVTLAAGVLSKLPAGVLFGQVWRTRVFFAGLFLMNVFFFDSAEPLWAWGIFTLSVQGVVQGALIVFRVTLAAAFTNMLTGTTAPLALTGAVEAFLSPLKKVRFPAEEIALIISAAVQFVPILIEEAAQIKKAQTARGARFESKRLTERAVSYLPLVIPVFLCAFRRADELALAMEARGWRSGGKRTKNNGEPLKVHDFIALLTITALCGVQFCIYFGNF